MPRSPDHFPASAVRAAALSLGLVALAFAASGCTIIFNHRYHSRDFTIYTDLNPQFLKEIGPEVEQIYGGFEQLFQVPAETRGRTAIILRGNQKDQEVIDLAYSPSLLGYYIPFLNLISVDTKPAWTREPAMLKQILLHEVAHHFIVSDFPPASKECWLNEGLAGNLEMTLFENGRFEYTLLNPVLLGIVRHAALVDLKPGDLKRLISLGWSEFHGDSNKELDYALSWSIVYYLLEHYYPQTMPLGERIRRLYQLDREVVAALEPRWLEFVRGFDLTGKLIEMARADPGSELGRLTPRWAVRQLGLLKFLDDHRSAGALADIIDSRDPMLRLHASLSFLKVTARLPEAALSSPALRRGRERIAARLVDSDQPGIVREVLANAIGDLLRADPSWVPLLIRLLEAPDGEVRAAAARGLSVSMMKPTVVNPAFWRNGELAARTAEVSEWQSWWAAHHRDLGVLE